ncbi:Hypothetical protein D9617_18g034470 [Elsinoe fawcettii]|nr:Hypothetical protein D9617_18g034470 [Elsinoe fawcettii]
MGFPKDITVDMFAPSTTRKWILIHALPSHKGGRKASLSWGSCGDLVQEILGPNTTTTLSFDCATLDVPLDYTDPESPPLTLSLVRLNATRKPVLGNALINPGGPGGSGIETIVGSGRLFLNIVDQYNYIGFDPRGTGKTIPFNCNATPAPDYLPTAHLNLNDTLFDNGWDRANLFSDRCVETQQATGSFLSTAFVARDMVEILHHLPDHKLNYVGISYGTFLGEVFAAMYPHLVGRFILDAVVNPVDFRAGPRSSFFADTDIVYQGFYDECVARPSDCALARQTTPSPSASTIRSQVESFIDAFLDTDPVLYRQLKLTVRQALYSPDTWAPLAMAIATILAAPSNLSVLLPPGPANPPPVYNEGVDAFWGISCLDTPWRLSEPEQLIAVAIEQQSLSYFANVYADFISWRCATWRFESAEYYTGPFASKTATPILFIGGKKDPITPLAGAFNASSGYEGSVVVTNDGYGHSFTSDPSDCTYNAVKQYVINGVLPEEGLVCKANKAPFDPTRLGNGTPAAMARKRDIGEMTVEQAWKTLEDIRTRTGFVSI